MKKFRLISGIAIITAFGGSVAHAASLTPADATVVASGLNAPRGLKFGPDGDLYIAEGGSGGTKTTTKEQCLQVPGPVGPYKGGNTGEIAKVSHAGKLSVVASGFPSSVDSQGDLSAVADVAFLGGQLYALIGGGGCSHGLIGHPNGVAKVNPADGQWSMIADLSQFALAHPGKYDDAADFEPDGIWYSMITMGDKLVALEPNHGTIVSIDTSGNMLEIADISLSSGHIVPTSMAVHGSDLYVGNLLYFPILPNWSRVMRLSEVGFIADNEIPGFEHLSKYYVADSKAGFTTVIAIAFGPDGLLYVLELSDAAGFPTPGMGKVVRLESTGNISEIVTGLVVPGGMTWGPDGKLYVSNASAVPAPMYGAGQILRFDAAQVPPQ